MFTTLTTFGAARGVTLDGLCIELFYPADAAIEQLLRACQGFWKSFVLLAWSEAVRP